MILERLAARAQPARLVALGVAALLLFPAAGYAGVKGTAHELTLGESGTCVVCHIPHKALGAKLWPADMSGQNRYGAIGALCYYCHGPGDAGGSGIIASNLSNVWDDHSHGRTIAENPDGAAAADASLPYVAAPDKGQFECTTCHNVHDDTLKPFLWEQMDQLCLRCHPGRNFVGGTETKTVGEWGNYLRALNPGSHPVGRDVFADRNGGSPIEPGLAGLGLLPWNAGRPGTHNLGPHLLGGEGTQPAAGRGIGCNTCHAVHGVYPDGGEETPPQEDLLAVGQGSTGVLPGTPANHANGSGGTSNALCEACHRGPAPEGYAGAAFPNPGGTLSTHPVDDFDATRSFGVTGFPAGWPQGSNTLVFAQPSPLCESCHLPHPRAALAAQIDLGPVKAPSGTSLLRDRPEALCFDCHGEETFRDHHPVGAGLMTGRFRDDDIGNQDADLTCDDCHALSGAHNWAARGVPGLDPNWVPKDSSLAPDQPSDNGLIAEGRGTRFIPEKSRECFECHTDSGAHFSPTRGKAGGRRGNPAHQLLGEGSHFLGSTQLDFSKGQYPPGTPWNATTGKWGAGGTSLFAGTAAEPVLVCESCHELQVGRNVHGAALLLEEFREGSAAPGSRLCEGCHGKGSGTGGSHPMTGDVVTRARDAARSNPNLQTGGGIYDTVSNPEGTFADQPGAPTGFATYPLANAMNCDSCHQVHDASASTLMLDNDPKELTPFVPGRSTTLYGVFDIPDAEGNDFNYAALCRQCHRK